MKASILTTGICIAFSFPALAQQGADALPQGFESTPLLKTSETRDKDPLAYPKGKPEITSVIGVIQAGGRTPLHQHPVPTYVYVLDGEVELQTQGAPAQTYKTGQAYIEALNRPHQLHNKTGSAARVLVVFIGETGASTTVASK